MCAGCGWVWHAREGPAQVPLSIPVEHTPARELGLLGEERQRHHLAPAQLWCQPIRWRDCHWMGRVIVIDHRTAWREEGIWIDYQRTHIPPGPSHYEAGCEARGAHRLQADV
jgi:hypothetical protein